MVERPPQPTDDDNAKAQQQHRRLAWRLAGAGLVALGVLVVLLLACVLWIPEWLHPSLTEADLQNVSDAAKVEELKDGRLKLQSDVRTALLQGLGGLLVLAGAGITAWVAFQQVRTTRDQITETATASRNQLALSEQGQVTDRYTKAIDQLDDNKALAVRLGGLYALERIARDSPADRATIAEVICAYARTAPRPPVADTTPAGTLGPRTSLTVRAPDVQATVTILGRWRERLGEPPPVLDLHSADLQGADLTGAQLQRADIRGGELQGAALQGAKLQDTRLFGARLQGADLSSAELQDAELVGARLQSADLRGTRLQGADLGGAELQGADLRGACLQGADLRGAALQDADLFGARLQDARASEATRWPRGWNQERARAVGVQFVDLSGTVIPEEVDPGSPDEPAPPGEEQP